MTARIYSIATAAQPAADTTTVHTASTTDEERPVLAPETDVVTATDSVPAPSADHVLADGATTPIDLPEMLTATVLTHPRGERTRKHKRDGVKPPSAQLVGQDAAADAERAAATPMVDLTVVESALPVDMTAPRSPADDQSNPDWKDAWPTNELVMYAMLDPSTVQAPTVDGVRLIRTLAQITELDPETSAIGIVAKVPVQILPMARGYEPLYNEVTRARRQNQRVRPYLVEMRGICKRLNDQDKRFVQARRTALFGLQISTVKRIDTDHVQFGRWRGRGTVAAVRPFDFDGVDYYRVTLHVAAAKQKAHLRGATAQMDPVDVLIRKDHPHVARFRRQGQRLLVEAEITAHTSIMRDTHPALEGLDDTMRERLATVRQGIVLANMGEFPDAAAEQEFETWQNEGARNPGRPGRGRRPDGSGTGKHGNTAGLPGMLQPRQRRNTDMREQPAAEAVAAE